MLVSLQGWVVAVYSTRNTWAEITGLLSGASYVMLVRAHNKYGTSEPSKISEYIKTKGANDLALGWTNGQIRQNLGEAKVELNSADVLSSTAINVTWLVGLITADSIASGPKRVQAVILLWTNQKLPNATMKFIT